MKNQEVGYSLDDISDFLVGFFVFFYCALSVSLFNRYNTAITLTTVETNYTINKGIKSMIFTHANILTRIVNRATLTNYNVTCNASLTTPNLNA